MGTKQDALQEIVDIARDHALTMDEIVSALQADSAARRNESAGILTRVFGYIGGILVLTGLCIFVGMQWDDIAPAGRIMLTLGSGFCLFVMAVTCSRDESLERAAIPLFLTAALLEPTGILVALKEFSRGGDPAHGLLFMYFLMFLQQGLVFTALRRTVLVFTSLFFGGGFVALAFDLLGVDEHLNGIIIGLSLICIAWAIGASPHRAAAGLPNFLGASLFMSVMFDEIRGNPLEILYPGLAAGMIFLSTLARSRALLTVGAVAMIGFIGYFTGKHFAHTLGWPLLLMLMGGVLIGMSVLAVRINNQYIRQTV